MKIPTKLDPIFYYPRDSLKNSLSQQIVAKGCLDHFIAFLLQNKSFHEICYFSKFFPKKFPHIKKQTLAFLGAKYSKLLSHFNVVYGAFATDKNPQ